MPTTMFIAERTGRCRLSLRRFRSRFDQSIPADHLHNASVVIEENAVATPDGPDGYRPNTDNLIPEEDPRWPKHCEACSVEFTPEDNWQCNELEWYEGGGQRFCWGTGAWDGPPGAMIRAHWRDVEGRPPAWLIFLPNGTGWCTNDRAGGVGNYWGVTGEAPLISVTPSINDQSSRPWHGFITSGVLSPA